MVMTMSMTMMITQTSAQQLPIDFGATCEQLDPNSKCKPYLPYDSIYLPYGTNQSEIETNVTNAITLLSFTPLSCSDVAIPITCLIAFRQCNTINTTSPIIKLPSSACLSECVSLNTSCYDVFKANNVPINCSSDSHGTPTFTNQSTLFELRDYGGPWITPIQCDVVVGGVRPNATCLKPLVMVSPEERKEGLYFVIDDKGCALPCPSMVFSPDEGRIVHITNVVMNSVSFVGSVLTLLFFALVSNKLNYRMEIIFYFSLSTMMISIGSFMMNPRQEQFACAGPPGRYKLGTKEADCGIGYLFYQIGALASIIWWTIISYDAYNSTKIQKIKHFNIFKFFVWGFIILLSTIPLMFNKVGAILSSNGCWILNSDGNVYQYVSFLVPFWICLVLILYFVTYVIFRVFKIYNVVKDKKMLKFNLRMLGMMCYIFVASAFVTFFLFYSNGRSKEYIKLIVDWLLCISKHQDDISFCHLYTPDFKLKMSTAIFFGGFGLIGFLSMMTDPANKRLARQSKIFIYFANKYLEFRGSGSRSKSTSSESSSSTKPTTSSQISSGVISSSSEWLKAQQERNKEMIVKIMNQHRIESQAHRDDAIELSSLDNNSINGTSAIISVPDLDLGSSSTPINDPNNNNNNNSQVILNVDPTASSIVLDNNDNNNSNNNNAIDIHHSDSDSDSDSSSSSSSSHQDD
ncbi:hypothetical protein SAMD00019534_075650 [Acytostelium subglobosum LB1]|uniref:hypothetical protein n=1 Tax=Acytostelium subglobosum LB1 TaxID=1410327 RepID=UPI000644EECF|nr:hypothetical protein SAMD00019534_075650 [Acytostelium subglobosum LB1]GAM24390.1 hypothetical protein SAMD00019534_075650 [Acytostelium subglobosum LB1]|eukprot:XP_012752716.1 hypothetical protein SAMD00019534_075650 [Acytostelium subglobosum LB1]